ncbi:hypothetical protein CS022_03140 [Veronia nyctiphanis]|uniref:Uncharacterized protein n=1 Tax=Veronia nyctiphanis TaxID=1278244 RepID=A0A4Q0YZD3_9GAMM|nr:hypothetical protein [Veronia nyctiphanis]RXJ74579.1 hypothetical protein CS022_03140 [Veronia nyctiphanis]
MAITVRGIEKHQQMTDRLKDITNKVTLSGALIEGGYIAVKYHELYIEEKKRSELLKLELEGLQRKVNAYVSSMESLKLSDKDDV